jgi:hypothetical protein
MACNCAPNEVKFTFQIASRFLPWACANNSIPFPVIIDYIHQIPCSLKQPGAVWFNDDNIRATFRNKGITDIKKNMNHG